MNALRKLIDEQLYKHKQYVQGISLSTSYSPSPSEPPVTIQNTTIDQNTPAIIFGNTPLVEEDVEFLHLLRKHFSVGSSNDLDAAIKKAIKELT